MALVFQKPERKLQSMQIEVGSIVKGKVTGIAAFGAFVEIERGVTGLVHISEVSTEYVDDVKNYLKVGQEVTVKVISVEENGKMSLSIRRAAENGEPEHTKGGKAKGHKQKSNVPFRTEITDFSITRDNSNTSFENMLSRFKQDSDDKMQSLKRSAENKRSGGYKRTF